MAYLKSPVIVGQSLKWLLKERAKAKISKLPQMPKKTGWRKSAFGKTFPSYTRKDLAIDASLLAGGFGISKAFGIGWHKDKNKKKKKET